MEDVGNEYFDIRLQSSLFQDATANEYGIISKCKMHDLAELVSTSMQERIRASWVGRLRSLFSDGELPSNMLPGFKALRVLNLFKANIAELPTSIGKLKHLRYLDISETRLKTLPRSIGKLYNLQTLRARYCAFEEFPKEVQTLINLRHVYCDKRMQFPRGILGKLTSLRTLPPFYVDKEIGREIQELAALNQLKGQLVICNLEHVMDEDEARKTKLEEKKNVRHLIFVWTENRSRTNVSISDENLLLSRSCSNLEQLSITYCRGLQSIPELQNFTSLRQLSIQNCERLERLLCSGLEMPISLVELKIRATLLHQFEVFETWWVRPRFVPDFQVGSSQLETLVVRGWPKLKSLPQQIQNFTSLTYLSIQCFHGVEALPEWLGNLTSLTKLEIWNFKNLMYLPSVIAIQCLTKLKTLEFCGCPLLQSKEWPKISHIQHIDEKISQAFRKGMKLVYPSPFPFTCEGYSHVMECSGTGRATWIEGWFSPTANSFKTEIFHKRDQLKKVA
ncbi:unnamed protein product [Prunus armeniaca]|uniref:Rx N-terminal domain-containing protein n=1 Tax=Prunus armeniaca TaxID=36596 RepID=A0A6J5WG45_PRUAR|nr:unnamed protein product [Prunus armeniaca]